MIVSEVQVSFITPKEGIVAFASCVLDGSFFVSSIAVHQKMDGSGYRLTYPTRKIGQQSLSLFHPINRPMAVAIETAIFGKLNDVMEKRNDRYGSSYAEPCRV